MPRKGRLVKIAIDLRSLQKGHQNRGIGNYLLNILNYFPKENIIYVFLRYEGSNPITDFHIKIAGDYEEIIYKQVKFSKSLKGAWLFLIDNMTPKFTKLYFKKIDIFVQPNYLMGMPISMSMQKVVIAYDLIPFLYKNIYIPSWRKYIRFRQLSLKRRALLTAKAYYYENLYRKALSTLKRADKIISISETTTADLAKIANIPKNKITTIPLAPSFVDTVNTSISTEISDLVSSKVKYLIFIGGTDFRRKVDELVYAFNWLNASGSEIHLVLAGVEFTQDNPELAHSAKKAIYLSSYSDKIHLLGKINDAEKKLLLSNATAFVYPTLYEGFGLPIIEAMSVKCPVISFNNKACRETGKDAILYTASDDSNGIYTAVIKLLKDSKHMESLVKRGLEYSKEYTWSTTGKLTIDAIMKDVNK